MAALGRRGLEAVLDFIGEMRPDDGLLPLTEEGIDRLKGLVRCEYARYKEMDFGRRIEIAYLPCSAERSDVGDDLEEEMTEADWDEVGANPCYQASRTEPGVIFIASELRSRRDAGSAYVDGWEEELGECGAVDRLWIGIDGPSWGGFAFDRCERSFVDEDLQLARLLQPHLQGFWRDAAIRRRLSAALWALNHDHAEGIVLMGPSGIEFASDHAQQLLRAYFGTGGVRIPDTILDWHGNGRERPLVVIADGSALVVEAAHAGSTLFLRERAIGVELLTTREREVMRCVAEGLSTNEIARRLWIEPGTARKHLEHVYKKLGVRSRTAALAKLRVGSSEDVDSSGRAVIAPRGSARGGGLIASVGKRYLHGGMSEDRSYVDQNTRERERLRALVERLDEDELRVPVNEYWTVAGVLGHIAFWDARVLALADKLERGVPFSPSDTEPEDVDWINDASRPLIHAIPPLEAARVALRIAEETDTRVASLPVDVLSPRDPDSPLYALRASHRGEHLDDVEAALRARPGPKAGEAAPR